MDEGERCETKIVIERPIGNKKPRDLRGFFTQRLT